LADNGKISQIEGGVAVLRDCRSPLYFYWRYQVDKQGALKIIIKCAEEYHSNLEGKNLLFIFGGKERCNSFEAAFPAQNFHHLTGVRTLILSSAEFYRACLEHRLSLDYFSFAEDGTTPLKLEVLPALMRLCRTVKMVGKYNNSRVYLYTEKLVGNVFASIGFIRDEHNPNSRFYVPNTAIKGDIRQIAVKPVWRMLAVLLKDAASPHYSFLAYAAKGVSLDSISIKKVLTERGIDANKLEFFQIPKLTS
jgi:hypothetical protein